VWFGGHHERTLPRIAKWGDGWMPNAYGPGQEALDIFAQLRRLTEEAGRDPAKVGIEVWVSMGSGTEADWARETRFWKEAGCSHSDPDDELQPPPPPPHPRPHDGRPPDGAAALSCRGRGPALDEEGPRVRIPVLRQRLRLSSGSVKISSSADF